MRTLLWFGLLLAACEPACGEPPVEPAAPHAPRVVRIPITRFFPVQPGNRWRYRTGDALVASGVTGVDAQGLAAIVDDARSPITRVRVTDARAEITAPDGRGLTPLLVAPLHAGATWTFTPDEGTPCSARVLRTQVAVTAAGASLEACVEVETRCALGTGGTEHVRTDTYCPDVGRARMVSRFTPRTEASPKDTESVLVTWRVAGGPLPPRAPSLCEEVILLPSDLAAACPGFEPDAPFAVRAGDACTFGMHASEGTVRIAVTPEGAADLDAGVEHEVRLTETVQSTRAIVQASGCPEASAARVLPLLRSLIAR